MARLLANPICRVLFDGWESTTIALQQSGWNISVEEDLYHDEFRMLIEKHGVMLHAKSIYGPMRHHTERIAGMPMTAMQVSQIGQGPPFKVVQIVTRETRVYHTIPVFNEWSEMRPAMFEVDSKQYNPFDFPIFQKRNVPPPVQELIVEPQDVMQLLEQIKRLQAPEQAEIRRRNRSEVPTAHATILTFDKVA